MRASTFLSIAIAIMLAVAAVFGVQTYLDSQRQQIEQASRGERGVPLNTIVVARSQMRFGERITAEKLQVIPWASETLPDGAFTDTAAIEGATDETARFVLSSIERGEPVLASKITDPGQRAKLSTAISPGKKAVSIRVNDVLGVAGFVLPGDRVDVLLTRNGGGRGGEAFVDVLLQGVRVVAIDQTADDTRDQPSVVRTVTFEVTTEEAQKLTLGATVGTLSLALLNVVSADGEVPERMTLSELDDSASAAALAAERAAAEEAQRRIEQERLDAQTARLAALEEMIRSMGSDVTDKLAEVEQNLVAARAGEPQVVEKEVVVEVPPAAPSFVTIGVARNGQRQEYRVETK
ncbi:Flp pilus assembly protein CpaB [Seohaeicola saemankumensis]|uniref:Flp pilus assembly protein CpaB n=1 Tax=Seohaeicola saemankumensis TaxID=481181 RepID=A0ABW3TJ62_9RHOB